MADEVGSLKVLLTGDASSLESAVKKAEAELNGLEKVNGKTAKSIAELTRQSGGFRAVVDQSKKSLDAKKETLKTTEAAYKTNTKAIKEQISGLKQQKSSLQNLAVSKKEEIETLKAANVGLSKNSIAYKDNIKAIDWTKAELAEVQKQRKQVSASIADHQTALTRETQGLTNAQNAVQSASKRYEAMNTLLKDVERQEKALNLQETGREWQEVGGAVDTATKPLQRMALVTAAGGVAAAKFAIDFEDSFAGVEKTVEGTPEQLEAIKQGIIDLATVGIEGRNPIPQTTAELNELAAAGGQLGIQTGNILTFTETMAQMGTATNLAGEEGAQTLARFMNVANVSQSQVKNLGSSIVDLGNNYATTEAEIAAMALRMGATGSVVGIGAADILGYATALSSMGVEAEAGGSAVSRIWMEIQQAASSGGDDLAMFAELAGKSSQEFAKQWGEDASGAFQDFLKGLSESKDQIGTLSKLGFENIRDIQALQRLAGEQGFGLLTSAIQRANTAWMENTALQAEFDKKAETTASQIQVMKNNLVEAARSIGETFLPDIANASNGVKEFAQGIAKMDEGQKQTLITTGKWVIGLGAAAKGTSGLIKGVGNTVEAFGKLKSATTAGGVLAKFGPELASIGAAAPYAAAGIAVVGTAAYVGKKAYDAWYNSQYRWADGMKESAEKATKHAQALEKLNALKREANELELVIKSPDSSQEQIETARSKLKGIREALEQEYNLKIETDNSDLDETLAKLSEIERSKAMAAIDNFRRDLVPNREKYQNAKTTYAANEQEYQKKQNQNHDFIVAQNELTKLQRMSAEGTLSLEEYAAAVQEVGEGCLKFAKPGMSAQETIANITKQIQDGIEGTQTSMKDAEAEMGRQKKAMDDFEASARKVTDAAVGTIRSDALQGLDYSDTLDAIGLAVEAAGLNIDEYAKKTALAQNGVESLTAAWTAAANGDGAALNGIVNDYVQNSQKFGAAAQDTAAGAALIKNGFTSIGQAAQAGKLDVVTQQANELAHEFGLIPENKKITITAGGNISIIEDAVEAVQKVENEDITVSVNADGNIDILGEAGQSVGELDGRAAYMTVNAAGNIEVFDQAGQKIAEIDGETGTVTLEAVDETGDQAAEAQENVNEVEADPVSITASNDTAEGINQATKALDAATRTRTVKITAEYSGPVPPQPNAKGTSDFSGGLAMINDQRGVADPRELVEVGGRGYLFEGRDVVLPLPEHAKVYPAGETREILRMAGIPHYARGKDNDPWGDAKGAWSHRQKTALVPLTAKDYMAWIDEMREKFQSNAEAMMELDEMFTDAVKQDWDEALDAMQYSLDMGEMSDEEYYAQLTAYRDEYIQAGTDTYKALSVKIHQYNEKALDDARKAANEASKQWMDVRAALNDWGEIGDTQGAAYSRIMERNAAALFAGKMTWEEYQALGLETFETLATGYKQYSDDWISWEKEYNNMSAAEQRAALKRQREELDRFYADVGELTDEQYVIKVRVDKELARADMDAIRAEYGAWKSDFEWYQQQQDVYGVDFLHAGETAESTLRRGIDRMWEKYAEADPTYQQEILRDIDLAKMDIYKNREQELDKALADFKTKISDTTQALHDNVQTLRDSWTVADRKKDMGELERQMAIYEGAVTKEGRDKYEGLQEEYTQLQREEQIYNLEAKNNAAIERMEKEYEQMEANKEKQLSHLRAELLDASAGQEKILESSRQAAQQAADYISSLNRSFDSGLNTLSGIAGTLQQIAHEAARSYTYKQNNYFTTTNDAADTMAAWLRTARWPRY